MEAGAEGQRKMIGANEEDTVAAELLGHLYEAAGDQPPEHIQVEKRLVEFAIATLL